ncbi:MAG: beta-lactamase family protein [Desulfobacterales bacterium]|nr:beta-lactamase family protein [Desulfobacterales bacterium]
MQQAVETGVFPGGVLLAARLDQVVFHQGFGVTDHIRQLPVTCDTVYDLASLTKPLATAVALMHLVQQGRICVEDRLGELISAFSETDKDRIRIRHLLCHNSGLPPYRPYYRTLRRLPENARKPELRRLLVNAPIRDAPGTRTRYSDLGFMILDWVIERVSGKSLDRYAAQQLYAPMGIRDLFFIPGGRRDPERTFAPTRICADREVVCGRVHDENADAVGGVCGHAGLFGTSGAVFALLCDLLMTVCGRPSSGVFSRDVVGDFLRPPEGAERAMAFDTVSPEGSSSGRYFTPGRAVGHLGFTGTSFWMDPVSGKTVILLSNRVLPGRGNRKIRAFRPELHNAVMQHMQIGN